MSRGERGPGALFEGIVRAMIAGKLATASHEHKARVAATTAWIEQMETELAPVVAPLVQKLVETLPDDHPLQSLLRRAGDPEHQVDFILQVIFTALSVVPMITGGAKIFAQPLLNEIWTMDPGMPLSPADLADMVERNILDQPTAEGIAAQSGLNSYQFDLLVKDTGEPYGVIDALRLWREGRISDDELQVVVYYSRVRDQFLDDLHLLAYSSMSPADALELALKEIVDHDTAQGFFVRGGGMADQFDNLLAGAGNPPGVEASLNLWNHGLLTEDEVDTIIAHSRINPMFTDEVKLLRHHFLGAFQIHQALQAGAITADTATEWMIANGYDAAQAAAFATAGAAARPTAPGHLSATMISELYQARYLTLAQATTALENLQWPDADIPVFLELADARRALTLTNTGVRRVATAYLAKRLTDDEARADLVDLQIPTEAIDDYLATWKIERATEIKMLSAAQVGALAKKGFIEPTDAVTRWVAMGYSAEDAGLLLDDYTGNPPAGSPAATASATG